MVSLNDHLVIHIIIEFESYDAAKQLYDSDLYQEALAKLGDAVIRDFRVVEGID